MNFIVFSAQKSILYRSTDGGKTSEDDKDAEISNVRIMVPVSIKDGEKNDADLAGKGKEDGEAAENLLCAVAVWLETVRMTKIALRRDSENKEDALRSRAGDEEGLNARGTDIGDVGHASTFFLSGIDVILRRVKYCGENKVEREREHTP